MVAVLQSCRSTGEARERLAEAGERITSDGMTGLFARHRECCGLGSPRSYICNSPSAYTGASIADFDEDDSDTEVRPTDPAPAPCRIHIDTDPEPEPSPVPTIAGFFVDIPDNHYPYQSKGAVRVVQAAAKHWLSKAKPGQWTAAVLGGDFIDCYPISKYFKDPARNGRLQYEIDAANYGLDAYDEIPADYKYFQEGNHEKRLPIYIASNAPALVGLKGTTVPEMLRLEDRGWQWIPYTADMWLGRLMLTHDVGRCGKYAVHQSVQDIQEHTVIHHVHRMTTTYEPDAFGRVRFGGTFGCLLDFNQVDYGQRRKVRRSMVHGLGLGVVDSNGMPWMVAAPIIDERYTVIDGRVITA